MDQLTIKKLDQGLLELSMDINGYKYIAVGYGYEKLRSKLIEWITSNGESPSFNGESS